MAYEWTGLVTAEISQVLVHFSLISSSHSNLPEIINQTQFLVSANSKH